VRRSSIRERETTAKLVAERLREEIQDGSLAPGTRLRQNEVAQRFRVSTTPVREAFAQLQAEGAIRVDPHRGAVVFRPTVSDLIQAYEIREVLESVAVKLATPRLTPEIGRQLSDLIDRMERTNDPRRWLRLNDEFHLKLYACADRPQLTALISNLRDASAPYIHMFVSSSKPADQSSLEHRQILAACVAGDVEAAQAAVSEHLRHASRELERWITPKEGDRTAAAKAQSAGTPKAQPAPATTAASTAARASR
jgi:DNA-binding GntR family transcriptional regulator